MTQLPRALAPWAPYLELFPHDLLPDLGALIRRIDVLIGPPRSHLDPGSGEPDGFDGLELRGRYERLLLSEWLYAEEAPEEFLRRATMGEHAFLRIARREPTGNRTCVALFDAGPSQWGSPRLAHLAALIVLARRAAQQGLLFRWGLIQHPERGLETELTPQTIRTLLDGRSFQDLRDTTLTEWREQLGTLPDTDDLWLVGGSRLSRLPAAEQTSRLQVDEPMDLGPRHLTAKVHVGRALRREAELPLPDEPTCVRLLRNPFQETQTALQCLRADQAPQSNLVFDASGTKLFARCSDTELIVYPVPNSARASVGRPKTLRSKSGGRILAVGRWRKSTLALVTTATPQTFRLEYLSGSPRALPEATFSLSQNPLEPWGADLPPLGPLYHLTHRDSPMAFALVGTSLLRPWYLRGELLAGTDATNVAMLSPASDGLLYTYPEAGRWHVVHCPTDEPERRHDFEGGGHLAFVGYGTYWSHHDLGVLALQQSETQWLLLHDDEMSTFNSPSNVPVRGVLATGMLGNGPALLLQEDPRTLAIVGRNWSHTLPRASAEIRDVLLHPRTGVLAYATVEGEVALYSVTDKAIWWRFTPTLGGGDA